MSREVGTVQQLPFTPPIAEWLKAQIAHSPAANPLPFLALDFGIASIPPAILTVILRPTDNTPRLTVVALWGLAWAIAVLIAFVMFADEIQKRRDLRGGVFIRWTGPFDIRVVGRYNSVEVRAGSRALSVESGRQLLLSIQPGSGVVDYLPVSGTLLDLYDESGQILWSRPRGI